MTSFALFFSTGFALAARDAAVRAMVRDKKNLMRVKWVVVETGLGEVGVVVMEKC